MNAYLIADTRERAVIGHQIEFADIKLVIKQMSVGDYCVCAEPIDKSNDKSIGEPTGKPAITTPDMQATNHKIITIIERKSLEDYASSLKDGRADNKRKLINLRAETGCNVVYLIEGTCKRPTDIIGGIQYRYIESSIFHLMARDGITVMWSHDTLHTAQMLVRYTKSMQTLISKKEYIDRPPAPAPAGSMAVYGGAPTTPDEQNNAPTSVPVDAPTSASTSILVAVSPAVQIPAKSLDALLIQKVVKSDHEYVRMMWAQIPGISVETADYYMEKYTLRQLIMGETTIHPDTKIAGRRVSKRVINVCKDLTPWHTRILSACPLISKKTSEGISLKVLLTSPTPADILAPNGKKLGVKAAKAVALFNYQYIKAII